MFEKWSIIPDLTYEASTEGRIRNAKTHKIISQKEQHRYLYVGLYKNGKQQLFRVSRLIWSAFNGPIPEGMQVNHINEDKTDNRLVNLNLMTPKENINWGTRNKRAGAASGKKRTNGSLSKPVAQYTMDGTLIKVWPSLIEAHRQTGISHGNISRCCHHKLNYTGGFKWELV